MTGGNRMTGGKRMTDGNMSTAGSKARNALKGIIWRCDQNQGSQLAMQMAMSHECARMMQGGESSNMRYRYLAPCAIY